MKVWDAFNIVPNNKKLYETAFTHKSYLNENKDVVEDYERLEWIGDTVLQYYASSYIFKKKSHLSEGEMTLIRKNAVETRALCNYSKDLGLQQFLLVGNSEDIIREKLHADIYESFIGALFVDNQHDVINVILESTAYKIIDKTIENASKLKNSKTKLQEYIKIDGNQNIKYEITNKEGPVHDLVFYAQVRVDKIIMGEGSGKTKQLAEVDAAKNALSKMIK